MIELNNDKLKVMDLNIKKLQKSVQLHFKATDKLIHKIDKLKKKKYYEIYKDYPVSYLRQMLANLQATLVFENIGSPRLRNDTNHQADAIIKLIVKKETQHNLKVKQN